VYSFWKSSSLMFEPCILVFLVFTNVFVVGIVLIVNLVAQKVSQLSLCV
jgi:hypothetical protein